VRKSALFDIHLKVKTFIWISNKLGLNCGR